MSKMVDSDYLKVLRKMAENTEGMLNKKGIQDLETIQRYAGRGLSEAVPESAAKTGLKAIGEASDKIADKVAANTMKQSMKALGKGGMKAAALALGPVGLLASGAVEAFDAEALGEGSDKTSKETMDSQISELRKQGLLQKSSPEEMDRKRRIANRIMNRKRDRDQRREEFMKGDLSEDTKKLVNKIREDKIIEDYNKKDTLRDALQTAAEESSTPSMKEKYERMLRRRGR